MDEITCQGNDGTIFRFHAVERADVDPPFVSWVLVLEGPTANLDPQRVTAAEVVGDLKSMRIDEQDAVELVTMYTERMREFAKRHAADGDAIAGRSAWTEIVRNLDAELLELAEAG